MKISLNLLDNSYDYLQESYSNYLIADENGAHDEKWSSYENKLKWKIAYVTLLQSFELLIKEVLRNITPILIYEDIDKPISIKSKTVSGTKGLDRLWNCNEGLISRDNINFIKSCIEKRNNFIHYDVEIDSAEIKPNYCKIFEIYVKLHRDSLLYMNQEFDKMLKERCYGYEKILLFANNYIVFRNEEMRIEWKNKFLKEIAINKYNDTCIDKNGKIYKRISYGSENFYNSDEWQEYCPDCTAAIGEFHYEECDIEVCPKCGGQSLSCNCELEIVVTKTDDMRKFVQ